MSSQFILQPCKLRGDSFVSTKDASIDLSWKDMLKRFAVSGSRQAVLNVRNLRNGAYIGLSTNPTTGKLACFYLFNPDMSGDVSTTLAKDPGFSKRIKEVYKVAEVKWDVGIHEGNA